MHQSEKVSSTSGNDKHENVEAQDVNDDDSDIDSWPEDFTSSHDSKK